MNLSYKFSIAVVWISVACAACGEDAHPPAAPPLELAWAPCGPLVPGGVAGECALVDVPLDWDEPAGAQIRVFVKRFTSTGPRRGQLWLLDGGPGGTGAQFDNADLVGVFDQAGWDVYVPAHRGTGRSTPLGCAAAEAPASEGGARVTFAEAADCADEVGAAWGAGLAKFSAEQAGRDLGAVIDASRGSQRVAVWGMSYGTYWAQRYLQAFPEQPDAVILEGAVDLSSRISDQLSDGNAAGERWLDACAADAVCADKLGDPRVAYDAALAVVAAGSCAPLAGLTVPVFKTMARALVDTTIGYDARGVLAAMLGRIVRCADGDAEVLDRFVLGVADLTSELDRNDSDLALNNFLLTAVEVRLDLWPANLDVARAGPPHDALRFASAAEWTQLAGAVERWPVHARASDADVPAATQVPILVLSGGLDTFTPRTWGDQATSRYPRARQVVFPFGGHGVTFEAATSACALDVFLAFVADPRAALDTRCTADVRGIDFAGSTDDARSLYVDWLGTENLWGE